MRVQILSVWKKKLVVIIKIISQIPLRCCQVGGHYSILQQNPALPAPPSTPPRSFGTVTFSSVEPQMKELACMSGPCGKRIIFCIRMPGVCLGCLTLTGEAGRSWAKLRERAPVFHTHALWAHTQYTERCSSCVSGTFLIVISPFFSISFFAFPRYIYTWISGVNISGVKISGAVNVTLLSDWLVDSFLFLHNEIEEIGRFCMLFNVSWHPWPAPGTALCEWYRWRDWPQDSHIPTALVCERETFLFF